MSTQVQESTLTPMNTVTKSITMKKTYSGFDETLHEVSSDVEVTFETFTEDAPVELVMAKLNEFNQWREAANYLIRKNALREAQKKVGIAGGINREAVMATIKPFREFPQFADMIKSSDKRKSTAEEWNAQTEAILAQFRNVPYVVKGIKELSAKMNAESDE